MLSTPIPQRPASGQPGGLERAARSLDVGYDAWRGGVSFKTGCGGGLSTTGCDTGLTKPIDQIGDGVEFEPRTIFTPVYECDLTGLEVTQRTAESALTRNRSAALAGLLYSGNGNPDLLTTGIDATPAIPSGFAATFQGLIELLGECGIREVVFHVPAGYETYLLRSDLAEYDPITGTYHLGPHLIVVDAYPNLGPGGAPPPVVDGSQVWVWATGPVEIGLDAPFQHDASTVAANTYRVTSEQQVIVVFDPCCVYAAVAQVC